jgi:sulfate adenylyltransferase subunit 2
VVSKFGSDLVVGSVSDALESGRVQASNLPWASRNQLQTPVLLDTIRDGKFDAVFGGARRDEERARAKERVYSFRDEFGQWDPKNQRPELWNLYNGFINVGQHIRVFPLSNWTELDIWQYIMDQQIEIPSIYFAHQREVFENEGLLMAYSDFLKPQQDEEIFTEKIRFRTVGDMTITAGVKSEAETLEQVIEEISATRVSERGGSRRPIKVLFPSSTEPAVAIRNISIKNSLHACDLPSLHLMYGHPPYYHHVLTHASQIFPL